MVFLSPLSCPNCIYGDAFRALLNHPRPPPPPPLFGHTCTNKNTSSAKKLHLWLMPIFSKPVPFEQQRFSSANHKYRSVSMTTPQRTKKDKKRAVKNKRGRRKGRQRQRWRGGGMGWSDDIVRIWSLINSSDQWKSRFLKWANFGIVISCLLNWNVDSTFKECMKLLSVPRTMF